MSDTRLPAARGPYLATGHVAHERLRPKRHGFRYGTYFLMLPMRAIGRLGSGDLPWNQRGWLSFFDVDHGDGRDAIEGGALAWFEALLHEAGIEEPIDEVWLQTYPRIAGYHFKPVSFWYAVDRAGDLQAVVAEVNNTFGERHCYLIKRPKWGEEVVADKCFHVSPFCEVQGQYRFRFMWRGNQCVATVDHDDDQGPLITTHWSGELQPYTRAAARRAAWRYPLLSWMVTWRIHWQAFRLWLKRVPFFSKPPAPTTPVTQAHSNRRTA